MKKRISKKRNNKKAPRPRNIWPINPVTKIVQNKKGRGSFKRRKVNEIW